MNLTEVEKTELEAHGIYSEVIDENTYHMKLLEAEECWLITEASIELAAPILGAYYDGTEGYGEDVGTSIGMLVAKNLKAFDLIKQSKVMLKGLQKNGEPVTISSFLGAKGLKTLKQLVTRAYKENCLDFLLSELDSMGLKIPAVEAMMEDKHQL